MYIILKKCEQNIHQKLQGSVYPVVHNSLEKAQEECKRLARTYPGETFHIFTTVGSAQAKIQYDMTLTGNFWRSREEPLCM